MLRLTLYTTLTLVGLGPGEKATVDWARVQDELLRGSLCQAEARYPIPFVGEARPVTPDPSPRRGERNPERKHAAPSVDLAQAPPPQTAAKPANERWVSLFNGRDLDGWYTFLQHHGKNRDPDHVITIEDGTIHLYKHAADASKVVMGYIATDKEYGDYHLRVQYRWGPKKFEPRYKLKRDAGLYYHITGPDAVWPRSLQLQIQQTDVGDLIALYGFAVDTWVDPRTASAAEPTYQDPMNGGEPRVLGGGRGIAYQKRLPGDFEVDGWNTIEVIARGDTTTHVLNGHIVNQGKNVRLVDGDKPGSTRTVTRGRIALEIEAAELFFRQVELREVRGRQ
jgi:Domain of Unknown Function (DUF1080)